MTNRLTPPPFVNGNAARAGTLTGGTRNAIGPSLIVLGSVNRDVIVRTPRLPKCGESYIGQSYAELSGGKGANQAVAAARLGAGVRFVGRVGADLHGESLKRELLAEGITVDFVGVDDTQQTGVAFVLVDDDGQNSIIVIPAANLRIALDDLQRALASAPCSGLVLQLETHQRVVIDACRVAKEKRILTVLDAGPAQPFPLEEVAGIDILTPNETETAALTGITPATIDDAARASLVLLERSQAQFVVIKLGGRGVLLAGTGGLCEHFPAHPISVVDTTGAGDALTAAMTIRYLQTGDIREAVAFGNSAGAVAATRAGARSSMPTLADVASFEAEQSPLRGVHV